MVCWVTALHMGSFKKVSVQVEVIDCMQLLSAEFTKICQYSFGSFKFCEDILLVRQSHIWQ